MIKVLYKFIYMSFIYKLLLKKAHSFLVELFLFQFSSLLLVPTSIYKPVNRLDYNFLCKEYKTSGQLKDLHKSYPVFRIISKFAGASSIQMQATICFSKQLSLQMNG